MFKGSFLLTLSNPVQAGTYECLLEDPSVADKCVQNLSVLKRGAHVTVHQVPARLSLLDAQVDVLRQKTEEAYSDHKDSQTALASDVSDLRSELEKQTVADTAVQQQMADLTEKVNDVMTSVTSLTSRVDDLSTENKQLKEKLKQQEDEMESQRDLVRGQNERFENLTVSYSASDKLKSQVTELATNFNALDSNLADLQSKLEQHNQIVYFTAYVTIGQHIHASAGQVIRFPQTVENRGNAYDPDTGIFTAPSDGGYMFLVSVDISRGYEWLKIMRNGEDIVWGDHDAFADIEWTSDSLADGATVKACIGETAELQWAFSLQPDDTVVKVEWFTIKGQFYFPY
nr:hypothetical protein BaRGS_011512 [Batillaria attramentaria]